MDKKIERVSTCLDIPEFDCAVVGAGHDKLFVEVQARHSALVLVWALTELSIFMPHHY